MYFKKLLKKLCVFNIVTLLSCNLVPSQTFAETYSVPIVDNTSTIPLEDSQLPEGSISITPTQFTGENVTLNIKINKKADAAIEFKAAAGCFASAVELAKYAKKNSSNKQKWVDLTNAFKEAAYHTAVAVFTNKDKENNTPYKKFIEAYNAANSNAAYSAAVEAFEAVEDADDAYSAASAAAAAAAAYAAAYSAEAAAYADDAVAAAYAAYSAYSAAEAAAAAYSAEAAAAAYSAAYSAAAAAYSAEAADDAYASAAEAADDAYNKAQDIFGEEANKYTLKSTNYNTWTDDNFDDAKKKAQAAANAIVVAEGGQDFVNVIYGETATHNLWVRLKAKTKDAGGNYITPAPSNANEDTEWIKVTNITPSADNSSITISADMGKALMPGNYDVYVILTTKPINISKCTVTGLDNTKIDTSTFYPEPTVTYDGMKLEKDKDYTVSYTTDDLNVTIEDDLIRFDKSGSCSVTATITGIGDYMGKVEQTFAVAYSEGLPGTD